MKALLGNFDRDVGGDNRRPQLASRSTGGSQTRRGWVCRSTPGRSSATDVDARRMLPSRPIGMTWSATGGDRCGGPTSCTRRSATAQTRAADSTTTPRPASCWLTIPDVSSGGSSCPRARGAEVTASTTRGLHPHGCRGTRFSRGYVDDRWLEPRARRAALGMQPPESRLGWAQQMDGAPRHR